MNDLLQNEEVSITTVVYIHWILFAAVILYGGLAYTVPGIMNKAPMDDSLFRMMAVVISAVALAVFTTVLFARKYWLSPESLADHDEKDQAEGQYASAVIIQGGLIESIAIYGLVLSFLFSSFEVFLPYGLVAMVLFFVLRPSTEDFEERLKRGGWSSARRHPSNNE